MFEMTNQPIIADTTQERFSMPLAGALVTFEGRVRNHNEGLDVTSLEYQSYEEMAVKVGEKIVQIAKESFDIVDAYCVHRVGHLAIEDIAVWVVVASKHRREAFEACQYIIDTVKHEVPIWKKEHYVEKEPVWVNCHRCAEGHSHPL